MKVTTKKNILFFFYYFLFLLFSFFYFVLFSFDRGNWYNPKTFSVALKNRRHCLLETSTRLCLLMLTRPVRRRALLWSGGGGSSSSSEWCEDVCCFDRFVVRVVLCRLPLWDPFACGLFFVLLLLRWCLRWLCECDGFFGRSSSRLLLLLHFWVSGCSSGGNARGWSSGGNASIAVLFKAFLVVVLLLLLLVLGWHEVLLCRVQVVVATRVAGNVDGSGLSGNGSHYWLRVFFLVVELMIVK